MRILFITHYSELYGANRSLLNLITYLKNKCNVECVVLLRKSGDLSIVLEKEKIKFHQYYFMLSVFNTKSKYKLLKRFIKIILRPFLYYKVWKAIMKEPSFDLVHTNSSVIDIGCYLSKRMKVPHIWHIREFGKEDYDSEYIMSNKFILKEYIETNHIISISNAIKEKINGMSPLIKTSIIYNGINLDYDYIKKYNNNGIINFCIVGVIRESKNQLEVVKACKELVGRGYKNFTLTIVGGGDSKYISKIKQVICENSMALSDIIKFTGYTTDVNGVLKLMDVGIIASRLEAFGRNTIEYMNMYLPVIGSNTGGTLELIQDSINGYIYEGGNINDLANKMEIFLNNPLKKIDMGNRARERSLIFSDKNNAEKIYELYKSVLVSEEKNDE